MPSRTFTRWGRAALLALVVVPQVALASEVQHIFDAFLEVVVTFVALVAGLIVGGTALVRLATRPASPPGLAPGQPDRSRE